MCIYYLIYIYVFKMCKSNTLNKLVKRTPNDCLLNKYTMRRKTLLYVTYSKYLNMLVPKYISKTHLSKYNIHIYHNLVPIKISINVK